MACRARFVEIVQWNSLWRGVPAIRDAVAYLRLDAGAADLAAADRLASPGRAAVPGSRPTSNARPRAQELAGQPDAPFVAQ